MLPGLSIVVLICLLPSLATEVEAKTPEPRDRIVSNGETVIAAKSGTMDVIVTIRQREVQIGTPSNPLPRTNEPGCTYSKFPCSLVDWVGVTVNGKAVEVPRSLFCDLADLVFAGLKLEKKSAELTLLGGDGGAAYIRKIQFNSERVLRMREAPGYDPTQFYEERIYRQTRPLD
jgi:hypothetical protein